jgi:hypothetical protein
LTNIDVDGLKKALFDRIEYMRGARLEKPQKSNTVEFALGLIGIYLSYIRPQVIITNMIFLARGKPSKGQVVQRFADNDRGAREAPLAQIGLDHGLLRMDRSNFEKWIKKEFEINPKQIIDTLVAAGARTQKASLGAGLDYKETSRNPVIDLDYTKYPELDNMMNQVTVSNVTHINKATGFNTP